MDDEQLSPVAQRGLAPARLAHATQCGWRVLRQHGPAVFADDVPAPRSAAATATAAAVCAGAPILLPGPGIS